jgi:hypothetical protein
MVEVLVGEDGGNNTGGDEGCIAMSWTPPLALNIIQIL